MLTKGADASKIRATNGLHLSTVDVVFDMRNMEKRRCQCFSPFQTNHFPEMKEYIFFILKLSKVTFQDTPTSAGMSVSVGFPGSPGSAASPGATSSPASLGIPNLRLSTLPTGGATGTTATGGVATSSRSPRPAKIDPGPIPEGIRRSLWMLFQIFLMSFDYYDQFLEVEMRNIAINQIIMLVS